MNALKATVLHLRPSLYLFLGRNVWLANMAAMNDIERKQVEKVQQDIVNLSPGQIEVLRAWVISSYDVRGNWLAHNYDDVPGFGFLNKHKRSE